VKKSIAVIGGGSWGTALVKVLHENLPEVFWYMRNPEQADIIRNTGRNPRYLSFVEIDPSGVRISTDMAETVRHTDMILLAIPSAFIAGAMGKARPDFTGKILLSAVKGLVPGHNLIMADFLQRQYRVPSEDIIIITGPSHSEEVGMERLTYLTFAGKDQSKTSEISSLFKRHYLKPVVSDDIYGTEYAAVLKNIFAIAAGIAHGLGYGDNFLAVLIANAAQEMKAFIDTVHPIDRDIKSSAYLGDLLVTAYSQFSRNRTLGTMIGKGYRVQSALLELNQVAEGYYASEGIHNILHSVPLSLPIVESVYRILYEGISPVIEFKLLSEHLK